MAVHRTFRYKNLGQLEQAVEALGLEDDIAFSDDLTPLRRPVVVGPFRTPNALGIHPMEGHDALGDGSPSELTHRRYERFARGGAGLIWIEAVAVRPEWRAHPHQLCLTAQNQHSFGRLRERILDWHGQEWGTEPLIVLQLTHSGRFTRPTALRQPIIASHHPLLDRIVGVDEDHPLLTDEELDDVENAFVQAGRRALEVGFRLVDVKSCNGYLSSELLGAFTRPGRYGGSFENRTRFLRNTLGRMKKECGRDLHLAVRLNVYDGLPHPYGWGVDRDNHRRGDRPVAPTEPVELAKSLVGWGAEIINISAGIPYYNPWVGRPFDRPVEGKQGAPEHPLEGVARLFRMAERIQRAVPQTPVVGAGYSWLRQFLGHAGAHNLANGRAGLVGVGREAFSYPDFARDLLCKGRLDKRRVCVTCSGCSELMAKGGPVGCILRDREVYGKPAPSISQESSNQGGN